MKFPTYIPDIVRNQVINYFEGDGRSFDGWVECLKQCEINLKKIKEQQNYFIRTGGSEHRLTELRIKFNEEENYFNSLKTNVGCIERLVYRLEMKNVFDVLSEELIPDSINKLFQFAWSAYIDFSRYRDENTSALDKAKEISKTAMYLAELLNQVGDSSFMCPSEFYHIPTLLKKTDNKDDLHMWRGLKHVVLGDKKVIDSQCSLLAQSEISIEFVSSSDDVFIDPLDQARAAIKYTWNIAPKLPALLKTVAESADGFNPKTENFIESAISKRQANDKAEYLRAFLTLLKNSNVQLPCVPTIYDAVATMATVVLNDKDLVVTSKDVRDLLKKSIG